MDTAVLAFAFAPQNGRKSAACDAIGHVPDHQIQPLGRATQETIRLLPGLCRTTVSSLCRHILSVVCAGSFFEPHSSAVFGTLVQRWLVLGCNTGR
jgi:hypothetical protein